MRHLAQELKKTRSFTKLHVAEFLESVLEGNPGRISNMEYIKLLIDFSIDTETRGIMWQDLGVFSILYLLPFFI